MSGPPPLGKLPPPVPFSPSTFTSARKSSFSSIPGPNGDVGPPTPPKTGKNGIEGSPNGGGGIPQSKSWTQLAPQRPFVNGRGNVQLPGAPQRFIPAPIGTSPSTSNGLNLGLPIQTGSPSVQKEGQQAYVRRSPSPGLSSSQSGLERAAAGENGSGHGTMSFPSQFGVRQRVAIRTSSRPPPRTSSSTGSYRGSEDGLRPEDRNSVHNSISSHSHLSSTSSSSSASTVTNANANSNTPVPSPRLFPTTIPASSPPVSSPPPTAESLSIAPKTSVLDRPRPKTPDPFSSNSSPRTVHSQIPIVTKRHGPRPSASSTLSTSQNGTLEGRRSPSRTFSSSSNSVLDRPRPKTPDPFNETLSPTSSSRAASIASESPTLVRSSTPTTSTNVMDRPRPKTPDSGAVFRSEEVQRPKEEEAEVSRSKTPDPSSVFSYNVGSTDDRSSSLNRSVMDRPRPRTPDPQGWLVSATTSAQSFDTHYTTTATSTTNNSTYLQSSTTSLPYSSSSTSISRPSFDSTAPSFSSPSPRMYDSMNRSRQSTGPSTALSRSTSSSAPPLLNLDFDFGSSFSNSDTLFGLSDLLNFGNDSTPTTASDPKVNPVNPSTRSRETSAASSRFDLNRSTTSLNSSNQPARNLPRKEAPKVDLKLELELEMERALPMNESLVQTERRHERELSTVTIESDRGGDAAGSESGRRTPAGFVGNAMGKIRKKGDSISSMRSFVTERSLSEASVGTGGGGSPQSAAKRRRRRSLASLLSFASNGGKDQQDREMETRSRTPEPNLNSPPMFSSPPPAPLVFDPSPTDFSFDNDKTLPPTPISNSLFDDDRTPPASAAAQQTTYQHQRSDSGMTRHFSRLRQRSDQSHSSSSGSRSGFQVVSGSTTRNRGTGGQGSISSLASSQQTHSSSRKDSFEYGQPPRDEPAPFTALPLSEPPLPMSTKSTPSHSATSSTSSIPFGRRLVQKITKMNHKPEEAAAVRSWTMPLKDHEQDTTTRPRKPPRRSSLTSLLNFGDKEISSSNEKPAIEKKKSLLGMSLPAGRKSDDMLARGFGRDRETSNSAWSGSVSENGHGDVCMGRRSFDLLTDREAIPRRPSTDNLLTLASAKLSKMALSDENGEPLTPSPATPVGNGFHHQSGDLSSGQSTPSINTHESSNSVIATAQIVKRLDGSTPASRAQEAESPLFARTVAPILVRSDSLRTTPRAVPPQHQQQQPWKKRGKVPDSGLGSDASMSSAWLDVEDALGLYSKALQQNHPERAPILTNTLLPFLKKEEDSPSTHPTQNLAKRQRDILFGWLATLTMELKEMQPSHRGACLEAVGAIAESHFLSAVTLESDPRGQARFKSALVEILHFAVEKLNEKAVYANTLVFSGRVFAIAFWRIEGVGIKLLRALPQVKRTGLKRVLEEAGVDENNIPSVDLETFPPHLTSLCLRDFRSYASLFLPTFPRVVDENDKYLIREGVYSIEMNGNWLIRWTASDSDLPFSFYRAYHKQLASYLVPIEAREDIAEQRPMSPASVITAPGYLFVAASLLEKTDALVHRNLRSVTSMGPNTSNFNTNDSANLSFGAKPKILELAHRRLVQTMLDIVGGPPLAPGEKEEESSSSASRRHVFSQMIQVWIRATVKRTSMWDTRSVFILLDYVEALIFSLAFPSESNRASTEDEPPAPKPDERCLDMFDFGFLFTVVKKILLEADNTVTLMRCIAFLYAHFEIFTLRPEDRTALCEGIILDEAVFTRLFLCYNQGTRGFWIRLLVWRLSRLGVVAKEQNPNLPPDEGILALFGLLNARLEAIRKRHDQLEPVQDIPEDSTFFRPKRSTICSTRGVKEAPWTVDELAETFEEESEYEEDTQELVRAVPPPPSSVSSAGGGSTKKGSGGDNNKTVSKVVSWLKGGLGKNKKGLKVVPSNDARIDPFTVERTATIRRRASGEEGEPPIVDDTNSVEWPQTALPTTIETGVVVSPPSTNQSPAPSTPEKNGHLSPSAPRRNKSNASTSTSSSGSQRRKSRPTSPAFFSFEFENGIVSRTDVDPTVVASAAPPSPTPSPSSSSDPSSSSNPPDSMLPTSPIRRTANAHPNPQSAVSPRVSLRFSKRASILPPAALELLKKEGKNGGGIDSVSVPPIPAQYRHSMMQQIGYDKKLHQYARLGLVDLELSFEEWDDWVAKLQEEEDSGARGTNSTFMDVVPRLAVSWPTSFTDD
ncbi:DUF1765 domain-containing protein [Sporobolomyces salmoneus]|uniref:DUF1765 domain-containing protein n=1 Tax=Sporobolomyces salmoneus TaxID=183962 RepID=UPI00316E36BE